MVDFKTKINLSAVNNKSLLCVGLDPDPNRIPIDNLLDFNKSIIRSTSDFVCAYKPNLAFFESLGSEGIEILNETIKSIPNNICVIGDGKRGDVRPTTDYYANTLLGAGDFDAVTVNPYGGMDTLVPFFEYKDKGIFIWCRSSNEGASDFQDLIVTDSNGSSPVELYKYIALKARDYNTNGNIGLVVGATFPDEIRVLRELCPDMLLLIPGIGAQSGSLEKSVQNGIDSNGRNCIINSSRSILYAGSTADNFEQKAMLAAKNTRDDINNILYSLGYKWSDS
tara:strand:+ start:6555 stop:7397 length:843 start_codon:yes stop_codon:yes gene_type:complete